MKLGEAITEVNLLKANAYTEEQMTRWTTELENYVIESVFNRAEGNDYKPVVYDYDLDLEKELMIPDPYSEIYIYYVCSKIDYWDREMDSYNNSIAMYNAAYQNFAAYMRRTYKPKSAPNYKVRLH